MNYLKALTIATMLAITPLASAQTQIPNIAGAYQTKDKTAKGEKLTLILLDATSLGRPGSYWGLLIENNLRQVNAYFVDPDSSNVLGMTPVSVSRDGEVGIGDVKSVLDENSYDYSLRITYSGTQNGQHRLSVSPGGKNKKGWVGQATFDKKAEIEWLSLQPSVKPYNWKRGCKITVTDFNTDGNASITPDKCREFGDASYQVREILPSNTFSLKADQLSKFTGTELPVMPNMVAFFVKKDGKRYLLLAGTEFGTVLQKIELKN